MLIEEATVFYFYFIPILTSLYCTLQNDNHDAFQARLNWEDHAAALAMTLVVPANVSRMTCRCIGVSTGELSDAHHNHLPATSATFVANRRRSTTTKTSSGKSPMPKLDEHILSALAQRGGTQGQIRAWSIETINREGQPDSYLMTYQMCNNRYCENIGRAHKSNNIMWTVDLKDKTCWQSCHDPDCRAANFRGSTVQLDSSEEVVLEINEYLIDRELAELNEEDIIQKATTPDKQPELEFNDPAHH